jgi:hypothetical protein
VFDPESGPGQALAKPNPLPLRRGVRRRSVDLSAGCEKVDTGFSRESRAKTLESITFMSLDRLDPNSS